MITEENRYARARQSHRLRQLWDLVGGDPDFLSAHADPDDRAMLGYVATDEVDPVDLERTLRYQLEEFAVAKVRPVFRVEDSTVCSRGTSPLWCGRIARASAALGAVADSVGRIDASLERGDLGGAYDARSYLGTCFVVGTDLVLTTWKVAAHFCAPDLSLLDDMNPKINFAEEPGRDPDLEFEVLGCVAWDQELDFALLETKPGNHFPQRVRQAIDRSSFQAMDGAVAEPPLVFSVGYPKFETFAPTDVILGAFDDRFEAKRASFGRLSQGSTYANASDEIVSDQTNLGNQPGSPVVDLETGLVIGLQSSGGYGDSSVATPIWKIQEALNGCGVSGESTVWATGRPPTNNAIIPFPVPFPRSQPELGSARMGTPSVRMVGEVELPPA